MSDLSTRPDWFLFRSLATLGQAAGVPRHYLAALALKELADNALDAGANCKVGTLSSTLRPALCSGYFVEDDGPGIDGTDADIARLFSVRRPLISSKLVKLTTRGAMGNGLRAVVGCVMSTGGFLRVRTRGRWLTLKPDDATGETLVVSSTPCHDAEGTRIEIGFGGELATQDGLWMAKLAVAMRGESRYEGTTSAYWYTSEDFFELMQAANVPTLAVVKLFERRGFKATDLNLDDYASNAPANSWSRDDADILLGHIRERTTAPKPDKLGVVGERAFFTSGYSKKTLTFTRKAQLGCHNAEVPAVIEAWVEKSGSPTARLYVNRTPITKPMSSGVDSGRKGRQYVSGCGMNHWCDTGKMPFDIRICITCPSVPITTNGKEPDLEPFISTIIEAVESAARKAKVALRSSGETKASKMDLVFDNMREAIANASSNGKHRFSLRQLFYSMRPLLQAYGEDVDYGYFSTLVGKYENEINSDVPGMYRDTRGFVQHPHQIGQIPLGTINVEQYRRPRYRFNKILYIEKGGFGPLLTAEKWGERHDCAILTSQGMASRAARDLLDLLGDTDEDLEFFCIHDADGPGTLIYEALVEGTLARPGRRVKVTNLGLDPWEAKEMGLEHETVERKRGSVPVAAYVREYDRKYYGWSEWETFLQGNRYELNAMTSSDFLAWLDEKMERHSKNVKVIPPAAHLEGCFRASARGLIRERLIAEAIRELDIEAKADQFAANVDVPWSLEALIGDDLRRNPIDAWEAPLGRHVADAVDDMMPESGNL